MRTPSLLALFALGLLSARAEAITFDRACEPGENLTISAVGDVLLHGPLQKQAFASKDTHGSLWRGITDLIQAADLAYANFEGPAAMNVSRGMKVVKDVGMRFEGNVYSGYPLFNYHPILAWDLKAAGFDIVSTANNHAMDRGALGADKTLETLASANLPAVGTRSQAAAAAADDTYRWNVQTQARGFNIAWIACTFSTNGMPDRHKQVLQCFKDADVIEKEIRELAKDSRVDAVIVTPHWGEVEYTTRIEPTQKALGRRFLEAGALAILGNHPHVTKPWEKYVTRDGRETFVAYSIGNFVSGQASLAKKTTAIVYLGLTKTRGQKAWINGVSYVPLYMTSSPWEVVAVDRTSRAPREAISLLGKLFDDSRRLDSRAKIETALECR